MRPQIGVWRYVDYGDFDAKSALLADWRSRPLPVM
jgi:hypothetical protein